MALASLALFACLASQSQAQQVISVNFGSDQAALNPTDVAGVVPVTNWNNASGNANSGGLSLVDSTGASTTATVTWNSNNTWSSGPTSTPNQVMMHGYLDNNSPTPTVTFTNLPAATASLYDVYIYIAGDSAGSRTGDYTIGGTTITAVQGSAANPFTLATATTQGNYIEFTNLSGNSFTLTAAQQNFRAPIDGIQIVQIPQVTWTGLGGSGGNANWDTATTNNWTPSGYSDGALVTFNDSGTNTNITIAGPGAGGAVSPASVTFSNSSATPYTFGGGAIAGSTGVLVNGGGTVTFNQVNSYTGATTISNGTLRLGSGSGLGNTAISVASGAKLRVQPATGTTVATGSTGSLSLTSGSTLDMSGDSNAGTFRVGGGVTIAGGATLNFDIGTNGSSATVTDALSVLGVATDSGTATINITGFGSHGLSNGNYALITAASGLNSGSFTLATPSVTVNGITYGLSLVPSGTQELLRVTAPALNANWIQTGATPPTYSWGTSGNWQGGNIPGAPGDSATFGASTANNETINLDQARSVGAVTFSNAGGGNYTIAGNGFTLNLDAAGAGAVVTNSTGSNMFSGPVNLNDNAIINAAGASVLTFAGVLSGAHSITVDQGGSGTVVFNNTNSFSNGLTIAGGLLQVPTVNNASTNGPLGNNSGITLGALGGSIGTLEYTGVGSVSSNMPISLAGGGGGAIIVDDSTASHALTLSGNITTSGSGTATLAMNGPGTVVLSGGSNSFAGGLNLNNGTLRVGNAAAGTIGSGLVTFGGSNTPTLDLNANSPTVSQLSGGTNGVVTNNAASGLSTLTLNGSTTSTFSGVINKGASQADIALIVTGGGTQVLTGTSTMSGGVAIQNGTLQLANGGSIASTNAVTLGSGSNNGTLVLGGAGGPSNQTLASLSTSGTGSSNRVVGGASSVSNLTINTPTAVNYLLTIFGGSGTNQNNLSVTFNGAGPVTLYGNNTHSGGTSIVGGTLTLPTSPAGSTPVGTGTLTLTGSTLNLQGTIGGNGLVGSFYDYGTNNGGANPDVNNYTSYSAFTSHWSSITPTVTVPTTTGGKSNLDFSNNGYGGPNALFNTAGATTALYGFTPSIALEANMSGYIYIQNPGTYAFSTRSDDGSMLFIDGNTVVNNNNYQGATTQSGTVNLSAGFHAIGVGFYQGGGGEGLLVSYSGPDTGIPSPTSGATTISNSVLFQTNSGSAYAPSQSLSNALTVTSTSTVNITNSLAASVGAFSIGANTLNVTSTDATTSPFSLVSTGATTLSGNATFNITNSSGGGAGSMTIHSVGDGNAGYSISKTGPGTLSIQGSSTYSGGTLISQGTVAAGGTNNALGTNPITLAGGRLQLQGVAAGNSIGIHFGVDRGSQFVIGASQSAGVSGFAQTNWNNAPNATGNQSNIIGPSAGAIVDSNGFVQAGMGVTWSTNGTYNGPFPANGTGDNALMGSFLNYEGGNNVATFTNIPFSSYEVVAYVGNEGGGADNRNAFITIGGTTYYFSTSTNNNAIPFNYIPITNTTSGVHPAGNYVVMTGLSGSSLTVTEAPDAADNSGLMGVQIINTSPTANMAIANSVNVTANSTIDVTGAANDAVGPLSIGADTLSITGGSNGPNAPYSLTTGAVSLAGNASFNVANNGAGSGTLILGAVSDNSGGFGLTVDGPGTVVLSAANNYSGNTTIAGGTLRLANGSTNNIATSPVVTIRGGGTLDVSGLASSTITIAPAQTLAVGAGGGAVHGSVVVGDGTNASSLTASVANRLTIDGSSGLTINAPSSVSFALDGAPTGQGVNPIVSLTGGSLTTAGNPNLDITGTPAAGTYDLFSFANGSLSGTFNLVNMTGNNTFNYSLTYLSHEVDLVVVNSGISAEWDNANGGNYSDQTKWFPSNSGVPDGVGLIATFGNGHTAQIGPNPSSVAVLVDGSYTVGTLEFNNSHGVKYTLGYDGNSMHGLTLNNGGSGALISVDSAAGAEIDTNLSLAEGTQINVTAGAQLDISGVISGGSGLSKEGNGTLQLDNANIYSGSTIVDYGTLVTTATGSIGSGALRVNRIAPGLTLVDLGSNQSVSSLSGTVSSGSARVQVEPGATLSVTGNSTTTLQAGLTLVDGGAGLSVGGGGSLSITGATSIGNNASISVNNATDANHTGSHLTLASSSASVGTSTTASIDTNSTLVLAGSASQLGSSAVGNVANRTHVTDNGTLEASGTVEQIVGGVDGGSVGTTGAGSVVVDDNSSMQANHVTIDGSLSIGDGSVFTIGASDASGAPTAITSADLGGGSGAGSSRLAALLASRHGGSSSSSSGSASSVGSLSGTIGGGVAAVPEPSSVALVVLGALCGVGEVIRRRASRG